jgi:hypothetical protein
MREQFVINFLNGPHPGEVIVGEDQYPWPLPGIIDGNLPGGKYVKVAEGERPSRHPEKDPIRTASYSWQTK